MTASLVARDLVLTYGGPLVIDGVSLDLAPGTITALIGANGCGKSTLLRALARVMTAKTGTVLLNGTPIGEQASREVARSLSFLPQSPTSPPGLRVRELVALGRFPHRRGLGRAGSGDHAAIAAALAATDLTALQDHEVDTLSGGQRQRAWIAMAVCQGADILLLDEPTSHLDLAHQIEVLVLLRQLAAAGRTVVVVLHDLQLAARYANYLVAVCGGRIAAHGPPATVITPDMLRQVFRVAADVIRDPLTGTPLVLPRGVAE